MSRHVTSFTLALILFLAAIAVVSVEAASGGCQSKRNYSPLARRNSGNSEQCPCAVAQATFSDAVSGITVYAQNECGQTTITGFLTGLVCPEKNNYTFTIQKCGRVIADLTSVLNAQISPDGVTQFTALDKDLNLNCDKDGIFNIVCNETSSNSYYKRQGQSPSMNIGQNGGSYANAPINSI